MGWLAGAVVALAAGAEAFADDQETIRQLAARLDALERQNRTLVQTLAEHHIEVGQPDTLTPNGNASNFAPAGFESSNVTTAPPTNGEDAVVGAAPLAGDSADEPAWYQVGSDTRMSASWKNGLEIESAHHDFRVHIGGRTQFDSGWYQADHSVQNSLPATNRFRDGVDFRRGRFRIDGVMYDTMEWVAEFDFVNSAGAGPAGSPISVVAPTDLWWQWNEIPLMQHFRAGNVKEPIGFEHLTSSRFLNFMERSFLQDAFFGGFNNGFTPGAHFFGDLAEERMTYACGIFSPTTNVFGNNVGGGEYALTGRLTALPYYAGDGRELLHVGMSLRQSTLDENQVRFRTRPSVRSGPSPQWPIIADTGFFAGDDAQQVNLELVGVYGPLSFASELLTSWVQGAVAPTGGGPRTVVYRGGYVEALYFLTGEHRAYNRKTGVFDRVIPHENAFWVKTEDGHCRGSGAWQLSARFQYLDLNSSGVNGGVLHDTTLGVNWFFNPNFKVQANYFYLRREPPSGPGFGDVQGFGVRLAHDF